MKFKKTKGLLYLITHPGYDLDGFNIFGRDEHGYNREGFNYHGYDKHGYDINGYNLEGRDCHGFDKLGYNVNGFDRQGYDHDGFHGYWKVDKNGFDRDGFDRQGFDIEGFDRDGFNQQGYTTDGYNRNGFNIQGYDKNGNDSEGFGKDGFNSLTKLYRSGSQYNSEGYDIDGYDLYGFNQLGVHKNGTAYDDNGYSICGYDSDGYDDDGYDANGNSIDGENKIDISAECFGNGWTQAYFMLIDAYKRIFQENYHLGFLTPGINKSYGLSEEHLITTDSYRGQIKVDLHGLSKTEAASLLKHLLNNISPTIEIITIIHGYHSGQKLMGLVREGIHHPRIYRKIVFENNKGRTDFELFARGSTESKYPGLDEIIDCEPELLGEHDFFI